LYDVPNFYKTCAIIRFVFGSQLINSLSHLYKMLDLWCHTDYCKIDTLPA